MQTKTTDTTYERIDVSTMDRQILTVLSVSPMSADVSVEHIAADGRSIDDTIGPVPLPQVPNSILAAYFRG